MIGVGLLIKLAGDARTSANHIGWVINRLDLYNVAGNGLQGSFQVS